MVGINAFQIVLGNRRTLGQLLRAAIRRLAGDQAFDTGEGIAFDDTHLVGEVELVTAQVVVDDRLGALVALDTFASEHLDVDDGAGDARRHAQRGVLHVGRLLAEDRAQQLLFRRQLGFALRRHLADQHVTGFDFSTDVNDAGLVQTGQLHFAQRRDVAGDFFRPELGVAGNDRQFLDVDRGKRSSATTRSEIRIESSKL